ncbi:MAG: hypothetical protein IJC52_05630, partial [Clostridia bacterium]|nr:hypothetical protein [Clostridia bacterium]
LDAIGSSYGEAATPAAPFAHNAAKEAPVVAEKANLLHAVNLNENAIIYGSVNYGSNALDFHVDLNKTPYLYYSFAQSANSQFTFALCNENTNNPWLTFLDSRQGGDSFNTGDANWNAAGDAQFFTDSVTGCIDMRDYQYDKNIREWIVEQVNFYNPNNVPVMVNYLFFGSAAIGGKSPDTAALNALIAKANGLSTDGMTDASVKTFRSALSAATYVDRHDTSATARAYAALSDAMGALAPVKVTEVDTSNLVSVKNFHVSHSKWICGSTLTAINSETSYVTAKTVDGGMSLHRSSVSPHTYPNVLYNGTVTEFTVQPYGGIYLKLNMEARTGWAIAMQVVQDGKAAVRVRLNEGIVNSNYNLNADGYYGTYNDVYDVSEVFVRYGIDPTAPMTISGMSITTVGDGDGWNTFYHLELLTGKATSSNYYELEDLIAYAEQHTKSMYTSASWSTMQSALTKAKTAMSTAGLTQPQINMAVFRLQNALDALELSTFYEPHNSLLSNDISIWQTNNGLAKATRNGDGDTIIENTNGTWSSADYIFPKTRRIRVATTQLELNMNVADAANLILLVDGEWVSISKYLTTNVNGEDVLAGDYNVKVPLSTIFKDKAAVDIGGVRVWSVGALGKNAVTIRKMTLDNLDTFTFDRTLTYGAAATPANPFMKHAAKNGPSVSHKVDVLAACGLDHPSMPGYASYGWNKLRLIVDLTKTPYLYYSIAQPADSKATFALTNENTYAPYFTFLDNNLGGTTMATSVDIWNAYTDDSQFVAGSVTGCIDMRTLLKDSSATTWQVNAMTLYSLAGANATMSYLYFGSAPLDDGYEEEPVTYEPGDFDLNGKVDTNDARQVLFLMVTDDLGDTSPVQIAAGDFDRDGRLSSSDVRLILDKTVRL